MQGKGEGREEEREGGEAGKMVGGNKVKKIGRDGQTDSTASFGQVFKTVIYARASKLHPNSLHLVTGTLRVTIVWGTGG